ncbi:MAG: 5-(carboxyamino)imidazole ribonucleotide mutase [Candidatus Kapabacteria bacterium]|nr:5-(carboxyamino)imidazole ribonucleotide mutase [Candidatus Kapabacteria bacterium]MCS7169804.1 5-(carboxyamino)imidazole ribonucleotide mutase [Candidatus Kapabacteria bacterium]MDW7997361.1 5-(carboxyamino)imidazole ribonucleotide mutase [Bacteroidota bacterium]MDW8224684.1 5-(carboxyamino)imidazole ribonucleotide mutase [Bacteroidota bacterium]
MGTPLVGIVMGSESDLEVMQEAADVCREFDVLYEMRVLSAHRTPWDMAWYGKTAHRRGLKVLIAGAGGAAHLPGMLAAFSPLPVIGVPIPSRYLHGQDSLLSIVQMPAGVPVATVAVGGGRNAGLLAVQILSTTQPDLLDKVLAYRQHLMQTVRQSNESNPAFTPVVLPPEWLERPPWEL